MSRNRTLPSMLSSVTSLFFLLCIATTFGLANSSSCMSPYCPNLEFERVDEKEVKRYIEAMKKADCTLAISMVEKLSKFMIHDNSKKTEIEEFYKLLVPKIHFKSESMSKTLKGIEKSHPNQISFENFEENFWKFFKETKVCDYEKTVTYMTRTACAFTRSNNLALYAFSQSI